MAEMCVIVEHLSMTISTQSLLRMRSKPSYVGKTGPNLRIEPIFSRKHYFKAIRMMLLSS